MNLKLKNTWSIRAFFVMLLLLCNAFVYAQTITLKGLVTGEKKEAIIGATVLEKGTTNGVITDFDGHYELHVKKGATLVFSYVGYVTQEIKVDKSPLNVTLKEDSKTLEEVVVVGYGVQKKSSLTGAVSQVKSEDMQARTIVSAEQALQGKTAGVQIFSSSAKPGASPQIRIRGISSNGSSDPLYVVDGRIASSIGNLNPNDIESMEVLKDGASAAIYGAAAGNGVILITTKKGKGNGKISYEYQLASQSLGKTPKVMDAQQFVDYFIESGVIKKEQFDKNWDGKTNTDWMDVAFENSMMHKHNLMFQAGNDKGSLYASLSYLTNNGMVVGDYDTYNRITGMVNASWKIKPWLEIGTNNQVSKYKSESVAEGNEYGSLLLSVLQLDPLTKPVYAPDALPDNMKNILNNPASAPLLRDENGNYYAISNFVTSENVNPLIMRDRSSAKYQGFSLSGTTYLNFTPIKDFVFTSRLSYNLSGNESYSVSKDYIGNGSIKSENKSVSASSGVPTYYQWENFLNYSRKFGNHFAGIMLGSSFSESRSFNVSGSYTGQFKQDDPNFMYFAYANADATKSLSGGEAFYTRKIGYFGRLNYDYQGRYMAQVSLRADAADSSVLPLSNSWGYFPAASLGWVISQEKFMSGTSKWLDQLKLRLSWGQNGSTTSLGGYSYANVIAVTGEYPTGEGLKYITAYAPSSTGNKELKWETSEQTNVGIDMRMFRGRLTASLDVYQKKTKDLIVSGITPSTVVGNTASPVNAGNVTNKGIEFELGWQDQIKDFRYGIRANIATLTNKVTYIHPSLDALDGATFHTYGAITRFQIGQPAWYFYGYKYKGIDSKTGNPTFEDIDNSGTITNEDKTMIGKGIPDFTYGITLNAAWKNFDMIVFGTGSQGNDIYSCLNRTDYVVNRLTYFTENRWSPNNPNGTRPKANATDMEKYMTSSASVFDGSYFKIKQIQLGYNLPKNLLKKVGMESLRVYGALEDFFTFTSYPGFDPEVTGVGNALGVDKGSYPSSKKVVFGLNLSF